MNWKSVFFALLICAGAISCEEENEESLAGGWSVTWQSEGEFLEGHIRFIADKAILQAYGNEHSSLLQSYTEMEYTWVMEPGKLILTPEGGTVQLEYQVREHSGDEIRLTYLGDIEVTLHRD